MTHLDPQIQAVINCVTGSPHFRELNRAGAGLSRSSSLSPREEEGGDAAPLIACTLPPLPRQVGRERMATRVSLVGCHPFQGSQGRKAGLEGGVLVILRDCSRQRWRPLWSCPPRDPCPGCRLPYEEHGDIDSQHQARRRGECLWQRRDNDPPFLWKSFLVQPSLLAS